jgi:PAS domain S-box-containing protein
MTEKDKEKDLLQESANDEAFMFDLLLNVFHESPDAVVLVDPQRHIFRINNQAQFLFGYNESEVVGKPIEIFIPDSLKDRHKSHTEKYADNPRLRAMGEGMQLKAKRKNGTEIPVEINLSPVSTTRGLYVIAIIRRKNDSTA